MVLQGHQCTTTKKTTAGKQCLRIIVKIIRLGQTVLGGFRVFATNNSGALMTNFFF